VVVVMVGNGKMHVPRFMTWVSLLLWMLRCCLVAYRVVQFSQNLPTFRRICSQYMGLKHSNFFHNAGTIFTLIHNTLPVMTRLFISNTFGVNWNLIYDKCVLGETDILPMLIVFWGKLISYVC